MTELHPNNLTVARRSMDVLMPFHLEISLTGHIRHAGPTIRKILPSLAPGTDRFLEVFDVRRPRNVEKFSDLYAVGQTGLRVVCRDLSNLPMKGTLVRLPGGHGALVNLSLGISFAEVVADHKLYSTDFAASDPTVDMLYLIEAKSVALDESKRLNSRLQGAKALAEKQAVTDTLTGLRNRRAMDHHLAQLKARETDFGLMHLDLDYFKQVNDELGHAAGDFVLQQVAEVLQEETRASDMVARVGGDEFVLIFDNLVDLTVLDQIALRIIERLERPMDFGGKQCRVSASIGTTLSTFYNDPNVDRLLSDADEALYHSKREGRARHTIFDPDAMQTTAQVSI